MAKGYCGRGRGEEERLHVDRVGEDGPMSRALKTCRDWFMLLV